MMEPELVPEREAPVLNPAVLARLKATLGEQNGFLGELIDTFCQDGATLLETIRQSLHQDDQVRLRRAVHSFKSNSASVGALALRAECQEMEAHLKAGDMQAARDGVVRLEAEYERVWVALQQARADLE